MAVPICPSSQYATIIKCFLCQYLCLSVGMGGRGLTSSQLTCFPDVTCLRLRVCVCACNVCVCTSVKLITCGLTRGPRTRRRTFNTQTSQGCGHFQPHSPKRTKGRDEHRGNSSLSSEISQSSWLFIASEHLTSCC